jgi:hypothetical protein
MMTPSHVTLLKFLSSGSRLLVAITDLSICSTRRVLSSRSSWAYRAQRPSSSSLGFALEPYASPNRTGEQYFKFFRETSNSLLDAYLPIEICGSICDNLPAQVAGLHAFLESRAEGVPRIMCILCLNYMIKLVFTSATRTDPVTNVVTQLPQVTHALNSPQAIKIVGRGCPAIIRTSTAYLVATIGFNLDRYEDAQITFQAVGDLMIPKEFAQVHLLGFPLSLFYAPWRNIDDPSPTRFRSPSKFFVNG